MFESRKTKRFGRDWSEFESNWAPLLIRMMQELTERTYRVDHNYAFLTSVPRWREIFATIAQGRISDVLLTEPLSPYIEKKLHPRTFNNRKGKGSSAAIDQVMEDIYEVSRGYTRPARIIKWDLKGCFPNALCSYMEQCYLEVIRENAEDLVRRFGPEAPGFLGWLASVSVNCYPAHNCERRTPEFMWRQHIEFEKSLFNKPPGIGVPIGRQMSQTGMGLYLNPEVTWLNDEMLVKSTLFMDDCTMVVPEEMHEFVLSLFPVLRERLAAKGMRLNERKFYDQPYQHGLEFLGCHIKPYRIHTNDSVFNRAIACIDMFNKIQDKLSYIDDFMQSLNSYLGQLKTKIDYSRLLVLVDRVDSGWWEYLYYNESRQCVNCRAGYTINERLNQKYHLKIKKKMTKVEIQTLINEQESIILDRQAKLELTNNVPAEIAEGRATKSEYADKIAQRKQWQNDIDAAQAEIDRLEAIEPEESEMQAE